MRIYLFAVSCHSWRKEPQIAPQPDAVWTLAAIVNPTTRGFAFARMISVSRERTDTVHEKAVNNIL